MKKTLTVLTLLFSFLIFSQEFKFEEVVKVDSLVTKDELFNRARAWVAKTYKSEKAVLSIQDKESGEISGSGIMNYEASGLYFGVFCVSGEIEYKFSIYLKDGRYKYYYHSFVHKGSYYQNSPPISYGLVTLSEQAPEPSRGYGNNKAWKDIKYKAEKQIRELIESLKKGMNKKYEGSNDW